MPLIYVQRYGGQALVTGKATQYVTGDLTLSGKTIIELDPSVFNAAGTYLIFQYGGSFNYDTGTYASAQAAITALVTIDATGVVDGAGNPLTVSGPPYLTIDTGTKQLTLTLA